MRESHFVKQNSEKWSAIETELRSGNNDPRKIRSQLTDVTDDLSFARTFYPNRSVRVYLNSLARRIHGRIGRSEIRVWPGIREFYLHTVPSIVYSGRKELLVSFLVLVFSVVIGAFSSHYDENFARSILGDAYVEMTIENIRKGSPLGVYGSMNQAEMFIEIASNNLRVSLLVFLCGLLASFGSLIMMFRNGVMLGTFMYFFYSRNLEGVFNLTVWMHGTIEILTLVLMTQAGLLLGKGLIAPGTYSRAKAFAIWGRRGALLFLSGVPFILFAALIESFVTRYTEMPAIIKLMLILASLAFMLLYFVWYPFNRFKGTQFKLQEEELSPELNQVFEPDTILTDSRIFLLSIRLTGRNFSNVVKSSFLISAVYLLLLYFTAAVNPSEKVTLPLHTGALPDLFSGNEYGFNMLLQYAKMLFNPGREWGVVPVTGIWLGLLLWTAQKIFKTELPAQNPVPFRLLSVSLMAGFAVSVLLMLPSFRFPVFLTMGALFMLAGISYVHNHRQSVNFLQMLQEYPTGTFIRTLRYVILLLTGVLISIIFLMSPFYFLATELFEMTTGTPSGNRAIWMKWLNIGTLTCIFSILLIMFMLQLNYLAFTLNEIVSAGGLKSKADKLGSEKRIYGFESE